MSILIKKNPKTVNFLFTKVDECLQKFLTPTMLKIHQDEMNQSVYYIANLVDLESIEILDEENVTLLHDDIDTPQTTLKQMIKFVEFQNIKEIWSISIGNSSKVKHYVILLQNNGHIYSCLSILRCGIALQIDFNSQNLINLLEEFAENDNIDKQSESDEYEDDINNKENVNPTLLKNPKPHHEKGQPMGTKRIKSAHEIPNQRTKHQHRCKKCGNIDHYQKNCKIQRTSKQ
ncbi:unnamed protein product [Rhizophagus irregularis]|nr:unnamed protein product [Rhizophagus irregularis]